MPFFGNHAIPLRLFSAESKASTPGSERPRPAAGRAPLPAGGFSRRAVPVQLYRELHLVETRVMAPAASTSSSSTASRPRAFRG